ncbi:hypothetical protein D3C80_863980 [compost metagenome]
MTECQIVTVFFTGAVGNDQGWPRISFGFLNGFHRLIKLRTQRDLRHVNMAVHHHADAQILTCLALAVFAELGHRPERGGLRLLAASVGVTLSVQHQHVDVFGQAEDVIQPAEPDIVSPAVAANQPDGFIHQIIGVGRQLARVVTFNLRQQAAQFLNLLATRLWCDIRHLQSVDQLCRQLRRQGVQQTQYTAAVLIDR